MEFSIEYEQRIIQVASKAAIQALKDLGLLKDLSAPGAKTTAYDPSGLGWKLADVLSQKELKVRLDTVAGKPISRTKIAGWWKNPRTIKFPLAYPEGSRPVVTWGNALDWWMKQNNPKK